MKILQMIKAYRISASGSVDPEDAQNRDRDFVRSDRFLRGGAVSHWLEAIANTANSEAPNARQLHWNHIDFQEQSLKHTRRGFTFIGTNANHPKP